MFKVWIWEIISIFLTIGLIVAIISILKHYEGRTLPDWHLGINLSTLIALLATAMRTLMLVTIAEVLGQTKWSWFSSSRPLSHLQVFDRASRGMLGSLNLLAVAPMNFFVIVACLVTILSFTVGPFTQQAIESVACQQVAKLQNASVPVAHFMGIPPSFQSSFSRGPSAYALPVDMKGAMVNGLVNPTGNDSSVSAICQSGNCTFQQYTDNITYSSIGMCSKCLDLSSFAAPNKTALSDEMTPNGPKLNVSQLWELPNGMEINLEILSTILNVTTEDNMTWASSAFTDDYLLVAAQAVTNVTVFSFTRAPCTNVSGHWECPREIVNTQTDSVDDEGSWDIIASTCALYPCMKNYHGDVEDGIFTEHVVSTELASYNWPISSPDQEFLPLNWGIVPVANWTALKDPCVIDGVEYTKGNNFSDVPRTATRNFTNVHSNGSYFNAPEECIYSLSNQYIMGMYDWMKETLLTGTCIWSDDTWLGQLSEPDCSNQFWLSPLWNTYNASFESISTAMDDFTTAITNKFRTNGYKNWYSAEQDLTQGVVNEMTVCVAVNWEWLLMPIILTAATTLLLITMIIKNFREVDQPVWKTSVLPLIFYNWGYASADGSRPAADLDQLHKDASHIRAKFNSGTDTGFTNNGNRFNQDTDVDSLMGEHLVRGR